jgi:hypothetical protein
MKRFILLTLIFIFSNQIIFSQDFNLQSVAKLNLHKDKSETSNSTLPISIGVASFLYLFNPIVLLENDKIAFGMTKEVSVGFGYFGQNRLAFEYSYIFINDLKSRIFIGYEHDILLKKGLKPSHLLQGTPAISLGAGYFTNFTNSGYFGETSYGYSIRNDKVLIYPSVKLRYTYVPDGSDILDFSAGIIIGIANPFIDLKIRRKY